MQLSLQRAVLLVLGGTVPAIAFILTQAEYIVAITLVNVCLIWMSLRIATGGRVGPMTPGGPTPSEPNDT